MVPEGLAQIVGRIALIVLIGALVYVLSIRMLETRLIYYPYKYPEGFWQTETAGYPIEDSYFSTVDNIKLHAWFVPANGAKYTLLDCHGNGGNLTFCTEQVKLFHEQLNINVFIFDYRGYGRSEGAPSEEGLYRDADAAYDYLVSVKHIPPEQIIIYGQSLGGAVAVDLASRKPCAGLILESTFTSAADVAREILLFRPAALIMRSRFNSAEKIKKVQRPILFMHGASDTTISIRLGRRLFEQARQPKFFYAIAGAGHNDTFISGGRAYLERLQEFISFLATGPVRARLSETP